MQGDEIIPNPCSNIIKLQFLLLLLIINLYISMESFAPREDEKIIGAMVWRNLDNILKCLMFKMHTLLSCFAKAPKSVLFISAPFSNVRNTFIALYLHQTSISTRMDNHILKLLKS